MSASASSEHVQQIEQHLFTNYSELLALVSSFEKGSTADISSRLKSVEVNLQELRETVKQVPDINSVEQLQINKIKDIYRFVANQVKIIEGLGKLNRKMSSSSPSKKDPAHEGTTFNDKDFGCPFCPSMILKGKLAVWKDRQWELPLARQQKGVDTQMEMLTGFWEVKQLFDFHDAGFTNDVNGQKYITCAECEYGPVGFVDPTTKLCYVSPQRIRLEDRPEEKESNNESASVTELV